MDINRYKFYVRDIGVSDTELQNILNDVIEDIAISTGIFQKAFGFTIEPEIELYNFDALLDMYERNQTEIANLTLDSITESELIEYLKDPTNFTVDVTETSTVGITPNKFLNTLDIITLNGNSLVSMIKDFEYISNNSYRYKYANTIRDKIEAICLCSIIPDISNIRPEVEAIMRNAIIKGLKYFTDTTMNAQNVNPVNFKFQEYEKAKIELQNKYPTILGYQTKGVIL
jgi:hypothetical protein